MQLLDAGTIRANILERQPAAVQTLLVVAVAAGTAIGAQIEIPHQPVPYTLQTFFVLLSGSVLGRRNGALSQLLYLAAGAIGLPVFAHWSGGIARLAGPTGGYLLSFPIAALVVGSIVHRFRSVAGLISGMVCGMLMIFCLGTLQLGILYYHDVQDAIVNGFLIFSWWDILKLAAAIVVSSRWTGYSLRQP